MDNTKPKKIISFKIDNGLIGGNKQNIVEFIKTNSINKIKDGLLELLKNDQYCDEVLGKGMMGEVSISKVGEYIDFKINNKMYKIPIVVKKANQDGVFDMVINKNILYIYSYTNLNGETLILYYIYELIKKKLSPHLPLIIGHSMCNNKNVNRIITEKQGMDNIITVKKHGFDDDMLWNDKYVYEPEYKTKLATLNDLLTYIHYNKDGEKIKLPNSQVVNIIELMDYLTISYLHTHMILTENNIIPSDMHPSNIFIHWITNESYIKNVKYIIYKVNNKYIKIKTFGLILKIGDVGTFIIHPKKDVYILGQCGNLEKSYDLIKYITKPNYGIDSFLNIFKFELPYNLYKKTIVYNILTSHPYDKKVWLSIPYKLLDDFPTSKQMLEKFEKYFVEKPKENDDTLII